MDRQEAENYVYQSYLRAEPFQDRNAPDAIKRHPELTEDLLRENAQIPAAVVTGSKGKGSVTALLSAVLGTALRTGRMTSPHLVRFNERFCVDGIPITDAEFVSEMEEVKAALDPIDRALPEGICISPMGVQALLALRWFRRRGVQAAVYECGKGAQYDDVNRIPHTYAILGPIFAEHTRELGSTTWEIARDKAHVITPEVKVAFSARQAPEVLRILRSRAAEMGARLLVCGEDFDAPQIRFSGQGMRFDVRIFSDRLPGFEVPMLGDFWAENAALALACGREMLGEESWRAHLPAIREALQRTHWPGRMEVLRRDPLLILDACIHPASCAGVRQVLEKLGIPKVNLILGIPEDKDYPGVAREMAPCCNRLILTRSQNPHYVFSSAQADHLLEEGIAADWTESLEEAVRKADRAGGPSLILGTTSLVGEAVQLKV
ncbi:MAG: bifunctional protein FolC [Lachnospiraceae bacterium]|nr:bifunctional protein FolC [Lachnospiraceae bacterium]